MKERHPSEIEFCNLQITTEMVNRKIINEDTLGMLYKTYKWKPAEIAEYFGIRLYDIHRLLRQWGLKPKPKPTPKKRKKPNSGDQKKLYQLLFRLYVAEKKSTREIAKILNRNPRTIHEWLKYFGIPRRDVGPQIDWSKYE